MATGEHKEPNYMGVFWALLILTLAEVGIFYLHVPRLVLIVSLVAMALAKAGLVAAYFMHLRFEKMTLAIIVVSPLALSVLMLIGLTPDSRYAPEREPPKEWVLPGHETEPSASPEDEQAPGSHGDPASPPAEQPPPAGSTPQGGPSGT